jgi:hypothetical protein
LVLAVLLDVVEILEHSHLPNGRRGAAFAWFGPTAAMAVTYSALHNKSRFLSRRKKLRRFRGDAGDKPLACLIT